MFQHATRLTPRERDIVDALLAGGTNQAIAARLGITQQSVKNRLSALYRKLGVRNRLELAVHMIQRQEAGQGD